MRKIFLFFTFNSDVEKALFYNRIKNQKFSIDDKVKDNKNTNSKQGHIAGIFY